MKFDKQCKSMAFLCLMPSLAHAEVMDKELSLQALCYATILIILLSFYVARRAPPILFAVVPLSGAFFLGLFAEISDPYIGPAIIAETGLIYFAVVIVGPLLQAASIAAGLWSRRTAAQSVSDRRTICGLSALSGKHPTDIGK